ncbi:hypothetical protein OQA88_5154 [Cercophora sp. LCS_1]
MHISSLLTAVLGAILMGNPVTALCKPACGRNDCNSPATTITIYHNDETTNSKEFPGGISFGYKTTPQAQVREWDFYGKFLDDPGYGFHVYGNLGELQVWDDVVMEWEDQQNQHGRKESHRDWDMSSYHDWEKVTNTSRMYGINWNSPLMSKVPVLTLDFVRAFLAGVPASLALDHSNI